MLQSRHALKVLHVLDHSLPLHSGYAFRSLAILREQQCLGWKPIVLTSPKQQTDREGSFETEDTIAGLTYYRTLACSHLRFPAMAEVALMRALEKRISEIVRKERPDIIHAHSPILNALPALRVARKNGIPIIYEVRALWEDAAVDHGTYTQHSWKYQLVRHLETFVCNRVDQVLVISCGLKNDLIERGVPKNKLTVIGNGVDPNQFQQHAINTALRRRWNLEGKLVVGFIGSFYRYEGLDLLVDAAAQLSDRWPELRLLLVGGGEVENGLKTQVKNLRLRDRVIIPGRIPHDQISSVYGLLDVMAYPRRPMRLTEIVTPLKPLEAMAMAKAIIGSDVGGHQELIAHEKTGLLFQAGSLSALVTGLDRLLADDDLRRKLGASASAWVRRERSWKKLIAGHPIVYARSLGNSAVLANA